MNKKGFLLELIVGIVLLLAGFFWFATSSGFEIGLDKNQSIKDALDEYATESCVPASCCHATECTWESDAPDCSMAMCTMECAPETMDCGAGSCEIIKGKCEVVWNE